jgi:hypothetical protein
MNQPPNQGSHRMRGLEAARPDDRGRPAHPPGSGQHQGLNEQWPDDPFRAPPPRPRPEHHGMSTFGTWAPGAQPAQGAWRDDRRRGWNPDPGTPPEQGGHQTSLNRDRDLREHEGDSREDKKAHGRERDRGQTIVVSVPAMRTFLTLSAVVVLSVVLSVIATLTVIAVMNAGVILPQYAHLNQPSQVSQLGICVGKAGKIWTPTNVGFCPNAKFVHVQPALTHP